MEEKIMEMLESNQESQKKTYTSWLVKCTQEQKENLQKECANSGKTVPEYLLESIQGARLKEAFRAQEETQKEFVEIDKLIERLQQLMFAKMSIVLEKERKSQESETFFQKKSMELEEAAQQLKCTLEEEFSSKEEQMRDAFETSLEKERQKFHETLGLKDTMLQESLNQNSEYRENIHKQKEEIQSLGTQLNQSVKNYNILENRLLEVLAKQKELEQKALAFENEKATNQLLENDLLKLQLRYDSLEREEALKREYLEKDIRREFEMKLLIQQQNNGIES